MRLFVQYNEKFKKIWLKFAHIPVGKTEHLQKNALKFAYVRFFM